MRLASWLTSVSSSHFELLSRAAQSYGRAAFVERKTILTCAFWCQAMCDLVLDEPLRADDWRALPAGHFVDTARCFSPPQTSPLCQRRWLAKSDGRKLVAPVQQHWADKNKRRSSLAFSSFRESNTLLRFSILPVIIICPRSYIS